MEDWLLEHKMTVVGTLMTNRIGIPEEQKYINDCEIFSSTIHWETKYKDIALGLYAVKTKSKGKLSVLLLSTMRPYNGVTRDDGKRILHI